MSQFLARILETKRKEVAELKRNSSFNRPIEGLVPCKGFARAIADASQLSVVAEVKKASPSKGLISNDFNPVATAKAYEHNGASAISVLTDAEYFQGSIEDLAAVTRAVNIPVLRKDFIIDELQIDEARSADADAVLLIVAALDTTRLMELSAYAKSVGLDVLVEVHSTAELDAALAANPSVLGVNNRDLHTFEVNLATTRDVLAHVPRELTVIAESGVHTAEDAQLMKSYGAKGILVGESLMRAGLVNLGNLLNEFRCLDVPKTRSGR